MGLVAGVAAREGVGGIGRALGAFVVVLGVVVLALVGVAIVAPQATTLVVWLAMGGAVWWLVRRHRGRQGSGY